MCGIVAYGGTKNRGVKVVFEGLKHLEYRGYDSWGIAAINVRGKISVDKKVGKIGDASIRPISTSALAIGHTRWATHGGITVTNAHPHISCDGNITVVHNGIVENWQKLKDVLIQKGHRFISQTDTEVIAHLIEEEYKNNNFQNAAARTHAQLTGHNAIVVLDIQSKTIAAIAQGSPLVVGFGNDEFFIASDPTALIPYIQTVHFLEDNQMVVISTNSAQLFDMKNHQQTSFTKHHAKLHADTVNKNGYPHFMLKEIHEQPTVIAQLLKKNQSIYQLANSIHKVESIYLVGCGTAYHAALIGQYIFSVLANRKSQAIIGSEFAYHQKQITQKDLTIFLSQSGETIDVVEPARELKKRNLPVAALLNRVGSTLDRLADVSIHLNTGPEICVLSTKVFTAKIAVLLLLAGQLSHQEKKIDQLLRDSITACNNILTNQFKRSYIFPLVKQLKNQQHILIIGRGISYPLAMEAALKIKESTYIHAEGFAGGELKHGPIALVEKGSPCIVFAPHDETYESVISNATEIKARGGYIIGISPNKEPVFDFHMPVNDCGIASVIPSIVTVQLLSYYLTVALNNDPDKPRNLAKSVTVK